MDASSSEHRILNMFYRWSSQTEAALKNDADLECLYDLERFVGAHLNKRIELISKKKRCAERAERAAIKRVEIAADRLMAETLAIPQGVDDGRWSTLSRQQRKDIEREKEIVERIYMLQLKQDRSLSGGIK